MIRRDSSHFLFKNKLVEIKDFDPRWEEIKTAYEVVRVMNSKVLFLQNHLTRFTSSIQQIHTNAKPDLQLLTKYLQKLIEINGVKEGNIKIVSLFDKQEVEFVAFFIPHYYPDGNLYEQGVEVGLLYAERENPHAKISNLAARKMAESLQMEKNFFEVLLINHQNHITEGSRSNIFFIQEDKLITPPSHEVLQGIIRNKIIEMASENGLNIQERYVFMEEISDFDSAFISGTSLHILPIKSLPVKQFDTHNHLLNSYMKLFKTKVNHEFLV